MRKKIMQKSRIKKIVIYSILTGFMGFLILNGIVMWTIFSDVKSVCADAAKEFKGDNIEVLINILKSDKHDYKKKNEVVWALGQIGDRRALKILEVLYTGKDCEKPCPRDEYICQYELKRAIKNCNGAFSVTRWMFRFL
jgi:hypothetical protein